MAQQKILSQTEIQLLEILITGLSIKNAGKRLGLSEYQAYKISKSIKTKLNAKNMPNAAFIAYQKNLIK